MSCPLLKALATILVVASCLFRYGSALAQAPPLTSSSTPKGNTPVLLVIVPTRVVVYVRDANGAPVDEFALVTVTRKGNEYWQQLVAQGGQASFDNVKPGRYSVQVVAPGYNKAVEDVDVIGSGGGENVYVTLKPESSGDKTATGMPGPPILAPKAQKELLKAVESLRIGKLADSRKHLETVYRLAPSHPDVNFFYGVYSSQVNDWQQAKSYWERTITFYPQHLAAHVSLGDAMLRENKPSDAIPHLKRALEIDPSSWRAHAFLADADLRLGSSEEAVHEAERALELGHERAARVRATLAEALAARGEIGRAIQILESHVRENPTDADAQEKLATFRSPARPAISAESAAATPTASLTSGAISTPLLAELPLPSWLPPDVDEKVPPVEPGVPCALNEVVQNTGKRVQEFIRNVDYFTATESLFHEPVNARGFPGTPETRKFAYMVSIQEVRPGVLIVYEYRDGDLSFQGFPGGMATLGLPALVLIFHPNNAVNYDMECEGLAHWNGGLAWQIHFRQRRDKPSVDRAYRFGQSGPSYPVALKGRAWIAADTFQIVRLETDLVAPRPEIRLVADRTAVEYGAVHFRKQNLDMWLPRTAEVFYDLKGHRTHRRHSFTEYMLFSVDDRQRISTPKIEESPANQCAPELTKPKQR
jgi:tetratricopeptide (TPR) repeat protein